MATFTFAPDEPDAGEEGVVLAYLVVHPAGVLLFDTGFGFGSALVEERYHPRARRLADVLAEQGLAPSDVDAVVNCHLHIDHAGQNSVLRSVPIHAQRAEWQLVQAGQHTIKEWVDFPGARYELHEGDYRLARGVGVIATPGHTRGHQSVCVDTQEGRVILVGQACYSHDEWVGKPGAREGRSRAPDRAAYDRSLGRLKGMHPRRVYFAHDRAVWSSGAA